MSTTAASHLSPAFPLRAPWGTADALRAWQQEALDAYLARDGAAARDFLAVATPGAGKTTFALRVASELLERRLVEAVTVVAPTEHLKHQWADAASRVGISLDPRFSNAQGAVGGDYTGVAVTYAQVAAHPLLHRRRTEVRRTLVILDEVHHGGDALSWGDAVREAFDPATRRLALTGTPFRSDTSAIPFVSYAVGADGVRRSAADYSYGYGRALADGVVRPVIFLSYSGQMRWRTRAGDEVSAALGEPLTKDLTAAAWRTALDAQGNWIPQVLAAADQRLTEVRRGVPDAAGLVIATDQVSARAYAAQLRRITGRAPVVVLSDEPGSSARIAEFSAGDDRWMVAVRMVSEGVDVPRLSVGVYATSAATPLYFAQAVGRFVRARRRGETASVFLPSVPVLLQHAAEMEVERDHALDRSPGDDDEHLRPRGRAAGGGQPGPGRPGRRRAGVRGARGRGDLRPGAVRRGRVRHRRRPWGPTRRPTTSACRGCSSRTRWPPCCRPGRARTGRPAAGSQRPPLPRPRPTGRSRRCARSSTGWWRPGTTGPGSRTARCTPSCVRPVADRWPRRRPPSSCRRGST